MKKIQGIDLIHAYTCTLFVQIPSTHCTQYYFEYRFYREKIKMFLGEELRCNLGHFHDRRVGVGCVFFFAFKMLIINIVLPCLTYLKDIDCGHLLLSILQSHVLHFYIRINNHIKEVPPSCKK